MRDFKFRAWDKITKSMSSVWGINFKAWDEPESIINYVTIELKVGGGGTFDRLEHEVELMQYTGLKDKNDKDIYEGDIVNFTETCKILFEKKEYEQIKYIGIIEFDNEGADYNIFNKDKSIIRGLGTGNQILEIIGNIYETPELLTKE